MPRRNENARSRGPAVNDLWRLADLKAMSEHLDRKAARAYCHTPVQQNSVIKTTAESIVRDFRRNEGFNIYEAAGMMRPFYRKARRPFFLVRWFRAVDWKNVFDWNGKVFNWACWAALIACLIYLGIFVFTPFTIKLLK